MATLSLSRARGTVAASADTCAWLLGGDELDEPLGVVQLGRVGKDAHPVQPGRALLLQPLLDLHNGVVMPHGKAETERRDGDPHLDALLVRASVQHRVRRPLLATHGSRRQHGRRRRASSKHESMMGRSGPSSKRKGPSSVPQAERASGRRRGRSYGVGA
eukprot:803161-Prymnesium_polylepis.1